MKRNEQETSIAAYKLIIPSINRHQWEILKIFLNGPQRNWTNRELAEVLGTVPCTVSPRVSELRKKGLLIYDETRQCASRSGRKVMAWSLNIGKTGGEET